MMNKLKWNKFHLKAPARIIWNIDRNVSVHFPQGLPKKKSFVTCEENIVNSCDLIINMQKRGHLHVYFIENYMSRA